MPTAEEAAAGEALGAGEATGTRTGAESGVVPTSDGPKGEALDKALKKADLADQADGLTADEKRGLLAREESIQAVTEQAEADAKWRSENPGKVLVREANPKVGGESFGYGAKKA